MIEASQILSEISFVLVVRRDNLEGLKVPPNVRALVYAQFEEAMNVSRPRLPTFPRIDRDVSDLHSEWS